VKNSLVLLLTGVGGYVDAVSYLALGRVFTANMTGNTVLLGLAIVQGDAAGAGRSALALGGFLAGGALGARLVALAARPQVWPRGVTVALAAEGALLVALAVVHAAVVAGESTLLVGRVALAALAMGVQSAAARRLDVSGVTTTFVTGTLTSLVSLLAVHGVVPGAGSQSKRLLAAAWVVYVAGAMAAAAAMQTAARLGLVVPVVVVVAVVGVAAARYWHAPGP
jgi:uncharacterized membrane protein YoaK (UPF0700 family)